jgi:hypothetical protein
MGMSMGVAAEERSWLTLKAGEKYEGKGQEDTIEIINHRHDRTPYHVTASRKFSIYRVELV